MNKGKLFQSTVVAALAGFIFGFDMVVISGADKPIQELWHTTPLFHGFFYYVHGVVGNRYWLCVCGRPH